MPANIEIKARARDWAGLLGTAEALGVACTVLLQEDVFFHVPRGRLKLRKLNDGSGQLIHYERPDGPGAKRSDYVVFPTADPTMLERVLAMGLSVRGIVRKRRRVYIVDNTRIHLDEVEGLGQFVEVEVMLQEGEAEAAGHARLDQWMARLGIDQRDLLDAAYVDLILKCGDPA